MELLLIIKYAAIISFGTMFLVLISAFLFSRAKKNGDDDIVYTPQYVDNSAYFQEQTAIHTNIYDYQYQDLNSQSLSNRKQANYYQSSKVYFPALNKPVKQSKFVVIKYL